MKNLVFILLLFLSFSAKAQQNLVPNPSFEDTIYCPYQLNQVDACLNWENWNNTPDYYNACNTGNVNVPLTPFGYQTAHSGNAFIGMSTYALPGTAGGPNYREIIGIQLSTPLIIGHKYYLSFYANLAYINKLQGIITNKIGLKFSTVEYSAILPPSINNFSHLYTDSLIKDSLSWVKVSGSMISDSNYTYLMVGNFFDDINTDTMNLGIFPYNAMYFIDDICVTEDSLYNSTWTGFVPILINNEKKITFYYNDFSKEIIVNGIDFNKVNLEIIDCLGRIVHYTCYKNEINQIIIETNELPKGAYYIIALTGIGRKCFRFVKT